jgi:hypothetical protein
LKMVNACACYHSYHIVLSSCLSSKNKDQNFVLILCGYKPWSLRLRKQMLESVREQDAEENICG